MDVRKIAVLTANLGGFDSNVDPVEQDLDYTFHRFTDDNFPPITGLSARMQYRIPKMFGWQMFEGYDYYLWMDASLSLVRPDSLQWLMDQLDGGYDMAVFKHPYRNTIKEEVDHLETYLTRTDGTKRGQDYLIKRYQNGLHMEQYRDILIDQEYIDDKLYASTAFIYKDSEHVRDALRMWWLHQSRYFTCDQIAMPFALKDLAIHVIPDNPFKNEYIRKVSDHD